MSEESEQLEETAVSHTDDSSNPPQPAQPQPPKDTEGRSELVKFGLLVLVLAIIIGVVALARPLVFERIIPAIMGTNLTPTPAVGVGGEGESANETEGSATPETGGEVFLPALTTDQTGGEDAAVVEDTPEPAPEMAAETAVPEPLSHVVQPGDTLTKIAQQYNISVQALMQANNLNNPNYIQVGQTLVIPPTP